jgi:hypothetical protein
LAFVSIPMGLTFSWSFAAPVSALASEALLTEQTFQSYDSARASLSTQIRKAKGRLIVATHRLGDGEIATLIHSMSLRGTQALVVIDQKGRSHYKSRHEYLVKAGIPAYFTSLGSAVPSGRSFVVVDNLAMEFGAPLDGSSAGSVTIRPSRMTPDEIVQAISSRGPLNRAVQGGGSQPSRTNAAKPSTRSQDAAAPKGDTIKSGVKLRARRAPVNSEAPPRSLPRRTVLGEIQSGARGAEEPVVPVRSIREERLRLDNEVELRAD